MIARIFFNFLDLNKNSILLIVILLNFLYIMKKVFFTLLLFLGCFLTVNASEIENLVFVDLSDLNLISKQENVVRLVKTKDAKIKLKTDNIEQIFFYPPKKFGAFVQYTGIFNQRINTKNLKFLEDWLEIKYLDKNETTENDYVNTTFTTLNTKQMNMFYEEIAVLSGGRRYYLLIQKTVSEKLKKEVNQNANIIIEFILLGYNENNKESYALVTNFSTKKPKVIRNLNTVESDYISARKALENEQYDFALNKLKTLMEKFPNNIDYKKDFCNANLAKYLKTNVNIPEHVINCYKSISNLSESAEANYILATIYYNDSNLIQSAKNKLIIDYTTKTINILNKKLNSLSSREKQVYDNSLYLRGITKILLKDSSGYNDLNLIEKIRPDLINTRIFIKN